MSEPVKKIWNKAAETLKDNQKVNRLVENVGDKIQKINLN